MAWTPYIILLLVAAARAGEITGDSDFPADNTNRNSGPVQTTPKGNGTDRSGYEPVNPIYTGPDTGSIDGMSSGGFQCPSIRYRNKCYYMALSQENWWTSRDYCVRIGHTLARIESSDEATFLASYLYEGGSNNYWVDLNDERTEGTWTWTNGMVGFTDWWAPNEPNGNRGENCGLLVIGRDRVGRLIDEPCGEWRRYICEHQTETVCRRAGYKRKCYWFSVQPATWFNAREYCATMGQRLARVTSTDESNYLARVMPRSAWIDLRYGGQGVGWTYADGSTSAGMAALFGGASYMMGGWGAGQRCAELRRYNQKEGRSVGADCNSLKQFICEYESLPAGSEIDNPEDAAGSVFGSQLGGPAVGPGGPVDPMDPQMAGGMAGLGPGIGGPAAMDGIMPAGPGYGGGMNPGYGMGGMGYGMGGGYGMG